MAPTKKPPVEFGPTQRLQKEYERGIRAISGRVFVKKRPEQSFTDWLHQLTLRSQAKDIQDAAEKLASRMVHWVAKSNYRTWREAASRSTQSRKLHSLLEAEMQGPTGARVHQLIRENANLISSLPLEAAQTLVDEITKAQQNGARPKTVAKMAGKRFPELVRSRVNLISRTETAKASAALTQARCERLSIEWYIWIDAGDQRTRKSHKAMHDVVVPFSRPPSPEALIGEKPYGNYNAGEIFNCRCLTAPVLTLADINFPARVYWNGKVSTMTKTAFKQIAVGLEER